MVFKNILNKAKEETLKYSSGELDTDIVDIDGLEEPLKSLEDLKDPFNDFKEESLEEDLINLEDLNPYEKIEEVDGQQFVFKKSLAEIEEMLEEEEDDDALGELFYDDSLSIEELEQRERIRQRQELAKAEIRKKKEDRTAFIQSFKTVGTLLVFASFTAVSSAYLWWLSGLLLPSILVGMVGSTRLTYWFYYRNNVLQQEEKEFSELKNIATQINFNMQNGKNVSDTLEFIKDDYDGRVGADLNYTYSRLVAEGELTTENFEKYGFTSFNIFLRNLQIAYHDGIDAKQLFRFPLSNINFEAIERDGLLIKNKASKKQEFMTLAIAIFITTSLRLFANEVYMSFLGYPLLTFIFATIAYGGFVLIATKLQKLAIDVSVSI